MAPIIQACISSPVVSGDSLGPSPRLLILFTCHSAKQITMPTFQSLVSTLLGRSSGASLEEIFVKTDPVIDGDDCLYDCDSCTAHYPKNFRVEKSHDLYGHIRGWSTHLLVATAKSDWVRNVANEKGSIMEAVEKAHEPGNGVSLKSMNYYLLPIGSVSNGDPQNRAYGVVNFY